MIVAIEVDEMSLDSGVKVSVVIPALNEGASVAGVVRHYRDVLTAAGIVSEIIVVDDGSSDDTSEKARDAGAVVIRNPSNKGYGYSLLRGIERAAHELIAITDADETYPAEALPGLIGKAAEFDMVVGRRTGRYYEGNLAKRISRSIFRFLAEYTSGESIPDINSGLRVFRKSFVLEHRQSISTGYSFTTTITLIAQLERQHLLYVPIEYQKRSGSSKVRWIRDTLRAVQIITEVILYYNPMKFFLLLALVPMALGSIHVAVFALDAIGLISWRVGAAAGLVSFYALVSFFVFVLGCLAFIVVAQARNRNRIPSSRGA